MSEHDDFYTPEQIDEQVDALLQAHNAPPLDQRMAHDLHSILVSEQNQEHAQALQRVLQRLLDTKYPADTHPLTNLTQQQHTQGRLIFMKKAQERSPKTRSFLRIVATLVAVLIVAIVVGSMLIISSLARQQKHASTAAPGPASQPAQTSAGFYTSNKSAVFRLDSLTHNLIWRLSLTDVTKIVPVGEVVYILQSRQSPQGPNAVVAVDANSGKTMWTHPFTLQGQEALAAQTSDLAFDQNQLYVGWEIWPNSSSIDGQVYVLDAANGHQKAVYQHVGVESLVVGDGILAVNGNYQLQVYNTATQKPLWHTSIPGGMVSGPVMSMRVVNHLVYAIFANNFEAGGQGQSYLAVYQDRTGTLVWQSPSYSDQLYRFAVDQNIVYFGSIHPTTSTFTGHLYAYNILKNTLLWSKPVDGGAQEPLVASNGVVYTVADNGSQGHASLMALDAATGSIKWQQPLAGAFLDSFAISNGVISISNLSLSGSQTASETDSQSIVGISVANGHQLWQETQYGFSHITPTA